MKAQERAAALIALVEADRSARAAAVLEPAAAQARELLRHARKAARARVATSIAEERMAYAARVGAAEARLATARRMAGQRRIQALVAEGWKRIAPALLARWRDPAGRAAWVRAALAEARSLLPGGSWRIETAAEWSEPERASAHAALGEAGIAASVAVDEHIAAGLRVACGNVLLDATLAGLLADRLAVEGRLLHWHLAPGPGTGQVRARPVPGPGAGK